MGARRLAFALVMGSVLLAAPGVFMPAVAATAIVSKALPQVIGPIAVTPTSRPYLAAGNALDSFGYVEEEYFLSGKANVYDWVGATRDIKVVAGPATYVTRILVRRPRDPARFSGNVEVTILNASRGIDGGAPADFGRMVRQGDVWIGVTTKAVAANALKRFDPARYAPLDWSNPAPPASRCANPTIIPMFSFGGEEAFAKMSTKASVPETEDGLVWDMIGQLGLLLKSEERHKILPGFGRTWVYMDGVSQSALYMRTWMPAFHDRFRTPDGRPAYDGYLAVVGASLLRINQCSPDVVPQDPRNKLLPPPDVPFISLSSEGEMWKAAVTDQPDVVTPKGGIVSYQVAGGSHGARETPGVPPQQMWASAQDLARAGVSREPSPAPSGVILNDFAWTPLVRGAYHNLQLWVRQGVTPPLAPRIEVDSAYIVRRDARGNALGGLRMPYIDVPTAAHRGAISDTGGFAVVMGSKAPFSPQTLKALYPDHATYVAKFSASTDRLVAGRWISAEDGAAMKAAAEAAPVPGPAASPGSAGGAQ